MGYRIIIAVFMLFCSVSYADTRYFDQLNREVSAEEYRQIVEKWYAKIKPVAVVAQPVLSSDIKPVAVVAQPVLPSNTNIERDFYGRPLRDAEGRYYTYPGAEGTGSSIRSYSSSAKKDLDMTREVHVKEHLRKNANGTTSVVRAHTRSAPSR